MKKKYILSIIFVAMVVVATLYVFRLSISEEQANQSAPSQGLYVALGDSVAAGVGLSNADDLGSCGRTQKAYPNLVAAKLNYQLQNLACSGATAQDGLVKSQLPTVFSGTTPKLITITAGADDFGWAQALQKCYTASCGTPDDIVVAVGNIVKVSAGVEKVLAGLESQYSNESSAQIPTVVVTGYYQLFPASPAANCAESSKLDTSELAWIKQMQTSVNDTLQSTVAKHKLMTYIPINVDGHELCTAESWVQGFGDTAPYHLNNAGQAAIGQQIVDALTAKRDNQ